jgi:hypothetical protein
VTARLAPFLCERFAGPSVLDGLDRCDSANVETTGVDVLDDRLLDGATAATASISGGSVFVALLSWLVLGLASSRFRLGSFGLEEVEGPE